MKKTLKMMSFFAIAFCTLWMGPKIASAANFEIEVINGKDANGINYGTITTTKNDCTVTAADSSSSQIITIPSGKSMFIEVNEGCTQTFKININEGYEIEELLIDRVITQPRADNTYTFTNISGVNNNLTDKGTNPNVAHSICVKYKKIGAPSSPNTGDVSYILPLAGTALLTFILMIVVACKMRRIKA